MTNVATLYIQQPPALPMLHSVRPVCSPPLCPSVAISTFSTPFAFAAGAAVVVVAVGAAAAAGGKESSLPEGRTVTHGRTTGPRVAI